jgi:hypothetical protein
MRIGILALALVVSPAFAQVFKCSINGQTSFSDQPCTGSGQAITVKPASGTRIDDSRRERGGSAAVDQDLLRQSKQSTERWRREEAAWQQQRESANQVRGQIKDWEGSKCAQAKADVARHEAGTRDTRQLDYAWHYEQLRAARGTVDAYCH